MNNSFLSFLTPKEPKFFPLLRGLSDIIYNASVLLEEGIRNYGTSDTEEFAKKIKEQEKAGDLLSNKIFDELNSTFITPFDREDIHSLADTMDDVIDRINSTVKKNCIIPTQGDACTCSRSGSSDGSCRYHSATGNRRHQPYPQKLKQYKKNAG